MKKTIICKESKKGSLYLSSIKDGKMTFVNLVKGGKMYKPVLEKDQSYEVEFTSYKLDQEKNVVTLFNVSGI